MEGPLTGDPIHDHDVDAMLQRVSRSVATVYAYDFADRWTSRGAGFFIDSAHLDAKHLVTNHHVIEYADAVFVVLPDGRRYRARRVLYASEARDVAMLSLSAPTDELPPGLPLAEALPEEGDNVYIVSAHDDEVDVSEGVLWALSHRDEDEFPRFHTTAPVVPGNSGSPVLDRAGRVVGIATAKTEGDGPEASVAVALTESSRPVHGPEDGMWVRDWGPHSRRSRAEQLVQRAEAFLETGNVGHALDQYRAAAEFDPDYAEVWFQIGLLRERLGEVDEALQAYENVLHATSLFDRTLRGMTFHNIGLLHARRGNFDEAERYARWAVEAAPTLPEPQLLLGFVAFFGFGDEEKAAKAYEALLELDRAQAAVLLDYIGR